jgi:hypothetical protein
MFSVSVSIMVDCICIRWCDHQHMMLIQRSLNKLHFIVTVPD